MATMAAISLQALIRHQNQRSRNTAPAPATSCSRKTNRKLIELLCPGVHGLVFVDGHARSTFLPAVWKSLPEPEQFLSELRLKAGLARDHWSASVEVFSYQVLELP